jgi:endonuclease/exonuclease/phosphatase (EEP) superfamily protein YafD
VTERLETQPSIKPRSRLTRITKLAPWLLPFVAIGLLLPWCNRLLPTSPGSLGWILDLAAHWQILYAPIWLILCLIAAIDKKRWMLLSPLALLPLWTASPALPSAVGSPPALSVAVANVHVSNRDPAPLIAWLRAQPADVVVLNELTLRYSDALVAGIGDVYPHRAFEPDNSPFGIGLMARKPLTDITVTRSTDGIPAMAAKINVDGRPVRIVAVHPVPPMTVHWHRERDRLLRTLAEDRDPTPRIVAGDLNATPWSTALQSAARAGGAKTELLRATGLEATWSHSVFGLRLGIPIDHVLAGPHWRRGTSERGPDIGSDHRPVRAELVWANEDATATRIR